ncbi:MAG TPA: gliding motility-associated C-terminal domain-containing protein [Paludibacter sp.]|nr:gliding motility-associated C-terminal domain-containing protein [Paludibacter sp.]
MRKTVSNLIILFMALLSAVRVMAQSGEPDVVCMGTAKNYYVNATSGSSYIWKINGGSPEASTSNSVDINWSVPGIFTLTVQEITKDNCEGPVQSLQVTVLESPALHLTSDIGTESQTVCMGSAIKEITYSFGGGATGVTVAGLPSGVNCVVSGTTATLGGVPSTSGNYTITTVGGAPCAEASLNGSITVDQLPTATISGSTHTCLDAGSPAVTFTGAGGTPPYTFTYNINGGTNKTVATTTTGDSVTVSVPAALFGTFVYSLVDVTGSKGCTHAQTGTATVVINQPSYSTTKRVVCPLQLPFRWNGIECPDKGVYTKLFANWVGCDSVATLELDVQDPIVTTIPVMVCASELPYVWNNDTCWVSGTYKTGNLETLAGCDSVAVLNLTVNSPLSINKAVAVCEGETYQFDGQSYAAPHEYDVPLKDMNGCDSVMVRLAVNQVKGSYTEQSIRLFDGESYSVNGHEYKNPGTYADVIKSEGGCDDVLVTEVSFINIPNTLTPNGKESNQVFMPGYRVEIYNRNGIKLYEGDGGWDATYKGTPVSKDTYFYILHYESGSKTKTKEGYLTVLR